jgi:hypothetical protein
MNSDGFTFDVGTGPCAGVCHTDHCQDAAKAAAADAQTGVDARGGKGVVMELFESEFHLRRERRQDRRYECQLPLRYRSGQERDGGAGTATDISRAGISVHIPQTLMRGSRVELTVDWPSLSDQIGKVKLLILGKVLRSDSSRTVIAIEKREFVRDRFRAMPLDDGRFNSCKEPISKYVM